MEPGNNPYTTPQAENILHPSAQVQDGTFMVDGKHLVIRDGAQLPNRCIKTNKDLTDGKRRKKKLYWIHPAWALLIFASPLVYIIVYYCIRKGFTLHYSISSGALAKQRLAVFAGLIGFFGGIIATFYLLSTSNSYNSHGMYALFAIIMALAGLILSLAFANILRPKKHRNGWFTLSGPGKAFVASIRQ